MPQPPMPQQQEGRSSAQQQRGRRALCHKVEQMVRKTASAPPKMKMEAKQWKHLTGHHPMSWKQHSEEEEELQHPQKHGAPNHC